MFHDSIREQNAIRRELARRERILSKPNGYEILAREDAKLGRKYAREETSYEFLHWLGENPFRGVAVFIALFAMMWASPLVFIDFVLPFAGSVWDWIVAIVRPY